MANKNREESESGIECKRVVNHIARRVKSPSAVLAYNKRCCVISKANLRKRGVKNIQKVLFDAEK